MTRRLSLLLSLLLVSFSLAADEARHFILEAQHVLSDAERAALAARGCDVQRILSNGRYLVRMTAASDVDASDPVVRSVQPLTAAKKIQPSAYRAAAQGKAFARVRVLFHDDVSLDAAKEAIARNGGAVEDVFATEFSEPRHLVARIPAMSLTALAGDERVLAIGGPPLRAKTDNATAALLSKVNIVQQPPYSLDGDGVVIAIFEPEECDSSGNNCSGRVDESHPEFQGRVTVHTTTAKGDHATHVAGTMIAAGLDPRAKGMAPKATLHNYLAGDANDQWLTDKKNLSQLGIVADNNSWGFILGWCEPGRCGGGWVWTGNDEYIGSYDSFYSVSLDKIGRTNGSLFVNASGNEADLFGPTTSPFSHKHVDENLNVIEGEIFCYSPSGSGNDCPATLCSSGAAHCEKTHHPIYVPWASVGLTPSTKNVLSVGATDDNKNIESFSSRGPTRDGRIKPEVVANGAFLYSTVPGGTYESMSGTSMSSPVVTGTAALLTQQWRKTFGGATPTPAALKTLLIAGAEDLGNPGPDYIYGFGFVDAKASADLIIADGGRGDRIRTLSVGQGALFETDVTVTSAQTLRLVISWLDPEVLILGGSDLADKTLVNDLDMKVVTPSGATVLPYVLDPHNPSANATRAVNTVDNVEEVEVPNAAAGVYHVVVTGTKVPVSAPQSFVFASNVPIGNVRPVCTDITEPNDSEASAYGYLVTGQSVGARICDQGDVDVFKLRIDRPGTVSVKVTAGDTPLRITLSGNGSATATADVAAGATQTVSTTFSGTSATDFFVRVEPTATIGFNAAYTLTPSFPTLVPQRRRAR